MYDLFFSKMQGILKLGDKPVSERQHVSKQLPWLLWKTLGNRADFWPGQEESQELNFHRA